ncbi:hypothetical protein BDP55DRAFT_647431 [Colletotrichum godetiae]|uniref:Uncharacterized protein n=1 Tax=Colletotrichum godetiae TaxID=1209918 RepID=A0AAJ0F3K4_9PEZI|nr:uncharacterized protein BDP55DRAFT_647431 [Colletotrichum godetiae]KAK1691572.1 hypothetical protein BDP55DRAFT_647431 [Colletotrichum godetiae]
MAEKFPFWPFLDSLLLHGVWWMSFRSTSLGLIDIDGTRSWTNPGWDFRHTGTPWRKLLISYDALLLVLQRGWLS